MIFGNLIYEGPCARAPYNRISADTAARYQIDRSHFRMLKLATAAEQIRTVDSGTRGKSGGRILLTSSCVKGDKVDALRPRLCFSKFKLISRSGYYFPRPPSIRDGPPALQGAPFGLPPGASRSNTGSGGGPSSFQSRMPWKKERRRPPGNSIRRAAEPVATNLSPPVGI